MMNWWKKENFERKKPHLLARDKAFKAVRAFFESRNYIEVHTPALQICPVMDAHIHAFETILHDVSRTRTQKLYLHTSPEFDMKKLLAAGMEQIYQICSVYRNAEGSVRHSPEFMLLEWYRAQKDYLYLMDEAPALIQSVAKALNVDVLSYGDRTCDPYKEVQRLSVCEAFDHYTGINLRDCMNDLSLFKKEASAIGVRVIDNDHWDDVFHAIMDKCIEPHLGNDAITILYDYPVSMAALSRPKEVDPLLAERFELYICGVEIANAFSELTDAHVQRERYEDEMALKEKLYHERYPADEEFFRALNEMPEAAGIALGIERLIMLCTGAQSITQVQWAPVAAVQDS